MDEANEPAALAQYVALAATVAAMRRAQREYFKVRTQTALTDSKRLEAAVDMRLAEIGIR